MAVTIKGYLSVEDAAQFLGVSRATVYSMIRAKEVASEKILNHRLLPEAELLALVTPRGRATA
jgi:excisionase family DNA binding protein